MKKLLLPLLALLLVLPTTANGFSLNNSPSLLNADVDGDGLTTFEEIRYYGTDPRNADTDEGGINDGCEVQWGRDPLSAADDGELDHYLVYGICSGFVEGYDDGVFDPN